jgi:hypothetical protein
VSRIALIALAACSSAPPPIVGEWDELCRIEAESTSRCEGTVDVDVRHTFAADGTLQLAVPGRGEPPIRGTWRTELNDLTFSFTSGRASLDEHYRFRIVGDQLVLWKIDAKFGTIFARHRAGSNPR